MLGKNLATTSKLIMGETAARLADLSEGHIVRADGRHMGTCEALAIVLGIGYVAIMTASTASGMSPVVLSFWLAYACVASLAFLGIASPQAVRGVLSDMAHGWKATADKMR